MAVASAIAYFPMVFIHAFCMTGWGGWAIPGSEFFVLIPLAGAALAASALPFLLAQRTRAKAVHVLLVAMGLVILFVPALWASSRLRMLGFFLAGQRAEPLIAGIEQYVREHGAPPSDLKELVPRYIPELPERVPSLYIVDGAAAFEQYGGNEWALFAMVSTGFINWDKFIYYPNQLYPEFGHGGSIQRIGRWAYVHE